MKMSQLFFYNNGFERNHTKFELIDLMRKSCIAHQDSSGLYSLLSLGLLLEEKIEKVIKEEMNKIGFSQVRLSHLQDIGLWKATGRYDAYEEELFKLNNRKGQTFCLSATCEEAITTIVKNHYNGTSMDVNVYQIGNKYRDELRVRGGLIRAKEFMMKDGYSFISDEVELNDRYNLVRMAYCKIFDRLGLEYVIKESDNGEIGGKSSQEFHVSSVYGEENTDGVMTVEIAHIFNLGVEYSSKMGLVDNYKKSVYMACYGIGISRLLMVLLEKHRDELGFYGTAKFNTFDYVLVAIDYKQEEIKLWADKIYDCMVARGYSILLDDREIQAGKKLTDSELIGCTNRMIISRQAIENGSVEVLCRETMLKTSMGLDEFK